MSLSQAMAEARSLLIRQNSIQYNYNIILEEKQYYGLAQLTFFIDSLNFTELNIDFSGKIIENIIVNNTQYPPPETQENFIVIPKKYLQKGRNKVSVMYTNDYNDDMKGCITFFQQQDLQQQITNQYVYTDFEPYGANRVFPCFDQPNLKAQMTLSIVAPDGWIALSNQPVTSTAKFDAKMFQSKVKLLQAQSSNLMEIFLGKVRNNTAVTFFDSTPLIPTYVFSFAAGPYQFIPDDSGTGTVPMNLYCVGSSTFILSDYAEFIFDVTKKAMAFYEKFFGQKYPFAKYDQIFIRDYDSWAMENVGLVTFDLAKTLILNPTNDNYYDFANVIAHELSHHWFGNFVTMKWWDGLWLNESFAEFISQFAISQINSTLINPLQPAAIYFRDSKQSGYTDDERSTTHPINGPVQDTDVAASIFDGITYNKGAAVLKQLMFLVGQENFSAALQSYFSRFALSNATIQDFLDDFRPFFQTTATTIDLWASTWLQTPSLNVFQSTWDPAQASSVATLTLYQSPFSPDYATLRCHRIQIGFFNAAGETVETQSVTITDKVTDITYDGTNQVKAILVNYNDQSFMQNYIDPFSLAFFKENISLIKEDVTRSLIWYNISQMNKLTQMRVDDYVAFILVHLFAEPSNFIVDKMLEDLHDFLDRFVPSDQEQQLKTQIFEQLYIQLQSSTLTDVDRIKILSTNYIEYAQTDSQIMQLNLWLHGQDTALANVPLNDNDLCWQVVKKVFGVSDATLSVAQKWAVFAYNQQTDITYRTQQANTVCKAIVAVQPQLGTIFDSFTKRGGDDLATRYLKAEGFTNSRHQDAYTSVYYAKYFAALVDPAVYGGLPYNYFQFFYQQLKPISNNYADQVTEYQKVLTVLKTDPSMAAHCINISKIIDDLNLNIQNNTFNSDSNLTLTQTRAADRFSYIASGSISYISHIAYTQLDLQTPTYSGLTEITFTLNSVPNILPIDFESYIINDLIVNGYNVGPVSNGQFLLIPRLYLKVGVNNIAVNYTNLYNNDGLGCLSFIDNTAQPPLNYTYTQFEPYSAHRFMPCFDQPDLKASASFNIILPTDWIAVANNSQSYFGAFNQTDYIKYAPYQDQSLLVAKYLFGKSGNFYVFKATEVLPTYLYCIIAGNYASVVANPGQLHNGIPMTVYSLKSYQPGLIQYAPFIFEITKLSLELFQSKFGVTYKFPKYDTVFCHQFKAGAMENPGVITFNDTYLYQQTVSIEKMIALGVTIAHQCAHNWFGDYVTMKWWDDLWLNESFADFMSYYCIDAIKDQVTTITPYTSGWLGGLARSVGGYREDQMTTTHSIRTPVANTSLATVYFDGITYQKGSMTLKQLMFLMGETGFFQGITDYLNQFKWSNATITDFLASMRPYFEAQVTQFTLDDWQKSWLLTPSLNVINVKWDPKDTSKTATLTITQTNFSDTYPLLRFHQVNIAYFTADDKYTVKKELINNTAQTKVTYDGSVGVVAILVNYGHQDFMKYRFDSVSEAFFAQNVSRIDDPLLRMVIWFYMNEEVRDGFNTVAKYKPVVLNQIPTQTQDIIYEFELKFLNQSTSSYIRIPARSAARQDIFDFVKSQLTSLTGRQQNMKNLKQIKCSNIEKEKVTKGIKSIYYPGSRLMKNPLPFKSAIHKSINVSILTDTANRQLLLKDFLIIFCSTLDQIDALEQWRKSTNADLINYPINLSQAWAVVKLVYSSSRYTSDQKTAIFDSQNRVNPGLAAQLTLSTCLALVADDVSMANNYLDFKQNSLSLTAKAAQAEGWNSLVHLDLLTSTYKPQYFKDIPQLSTSLQSNQFAFFYTNIRPIDDNLQDTIDSYAKINLPGSDMIGHMLSIKKIKYSYQLRLMLYGKNP